MNKIIIAIIASVIVVGGGSFYGGMKYGESKNNFTMFSGQNFQNMSEEQRQQFLQGNAGASLQRGAGRMVSANFLNGEVIAKDEQSLILKTPDGGSKIIFFSGSTTISKTTEVLMDDIKIGEQIMITGQQNTDGSYTAQSIQERDLPLQNSSN